MTTARLPPLELIFKGAFGDHADIQFYKGRKPPNLNKWPSRVITYVRWQDVASRTEDGEGLTFEEVIADGSSAGLNLPGSSDDSDVERLRCAIKAERPFFSPNELKVLAWKLDPNGGKLTHWAAKNGLSKGYASKLDRRIEDKLGKRMKNNS